MSPQQPPKALFASSLISTTVQKQLPEGYLMRPLEITDYHKGFYDCLAGLTVVGNVSFESFEKTFEQMLKAESVYFVVVIEDLRESRVVATGTLLVEQKFLRSCGKAGHIEDIVVHDSQRGKKFGIRLIDQLKHIGYELGCYKLLLTCSEANEPFYEKSGFERKDLNMAQYLNKTTTATASTQPLLASQPIFGSTMPTDRPEISGLLSVPGANSFYCHSANSSALSLVYANSSSTVCSSDEEDNISTTTTTTTVNSTHNRNNSNSKTLSQNQSVHAHGVPLENLSASMGSVSVK